MGRTRQEHFLEDLPAPVSHYTHGVSAKGMLYISGMVASDTNGDIIGRGDPVEQTRVILDYLGRVMGRAGSSFTDVVKVTVYLTDVRYREPINAERQRAFGESRPASTLVQIPSLYHPDALVEIDAVAELPE